MEDAASMTPPPWSIAVKTVGGGVFSEDRNPEETDHNGERNFTVTVSPEDGVTSLHDQIEQCTGLKASQQRLIYRGRLIGLHEASTTTTTSSASTSTNASASTCTENADAASDSSSNKNNKKHQVKKLKEIAGLGNGQTIHLVKKRDTANANGATAPSSNSTTTAFRDEDNGNSSDAAGSASLLAALLGLGSPGDNNNQSEDADSNATTLPERAAAARRWGGWRSSNRGGTGPSSSSQQSRRRPHYRLTTDDLEVPDPGTMESVRQGLLTLHTLSPHARPVRNTTTNNHNHPLSSPRTWYRGQWFDCRDTVNQWLEATVVDIVMPEEILPNAVSVMRAAPPQDNATRDHSNHYNDPAVGASDLEGRRRLLLEPCVDDDGDTSDAAIAIDNIEPGFQIRDNNTHVQLLLIHYNGWPHRWDEWIRSDSERIRPFRTRTRHSNMSSTASPTPQSIFHEAPSTNMRDGDEAMDRAALPAELERALSVVHELLRESIPTTTTNSNATTNATTMSAAPSVASALPWESVQGRTQNHVVSTLTANVESSHSESESSHSELWQGTTHNIEEISSDDDIDDDVVFGPQQRPQQHRSPPQPFNRRQLELLAPLLDRLGRTLVDAAPHIASLAASLPYEEEQAATAHPTTISEVDSDDDDDDGEDEDDENSDLDDLPDLTSAERIPHHAPLGGLLSILSHSRSGSRRHHSNSNNNNRHRNDPSSASPFELAHGGIDPDHVDYATGLVNTSRGDVRSGPRGSSPASNNDDVASLLGAYLAAASLGGLSGTLDDALGNGNGDDNNANTVNNMSGLGRLLRERGTGGGGGIDIHIHAVVTAPGATPGGLGFATLGGGGGATIPTATPIGGGGRNIFSARERSSRTSGSILRASRNAIPVMTHQEADDDQDNDDESSLGLFSELYSENPTGVDPNGSPAPGERRVDTTLQQPTTTNDHRHHRHSAHGVEASSRVPRMMSPGLRNDSFTLSPARRSNSNRRSSTGTERPRGTGWTRFFRRRGRSRSNSRHNNNNNNDSQYDL